LGKNQHVVPHDRGWAVKSEGASRAASVHNRQSDAIDVARESARAQHSELFIHNRHGQIRERDSHGKDDFPPKG
jgi:Uncharacterized protein conserved in bacteria (DUF2188)